MSVPAGSRCEGGLHLPIPFTWIGFLVKGERRAKCQPIGEKPYGHSSDRWQVFASVKNSAEELSTMPLDKVMGQKDQTGVWSRSNALVGSRFRINVELNSAGKVIKNAFPILSEFQRGFK